MSTNKSKLLLGSRPVGAGESTYIIAEVGQAHEGSLGMAYAYVEAAAKAGADAVKFQTHIAAEESTYDEPFRIKFSHQDDARFDYWKRMEFTPEQWHGLAEHARNNGIDFLSSPFSIAAVELLQKIGVPAWKIGSGEFRSVGLIDAIVQTKKPILFSTGMSNWDEIDIAVAHLRESKSGFALMQCTSKYPTPLEHVGLNVMHEMRERYECVAGLSDHSGSPFPGLAAMAQQADLLEVHVTFDRQMFGPDTVASVTMDELKLLTDARDAFHLMDVSSVDKDALAEDLSGMRQLFTKSVAPSIPLAQGTVLEPDMLALKKPGTGIPEAELSSLVGRKLRRDVLPDHLLVWDDIE